MFVELVATRRDWDSVASMTRISHSCMIIHHLPEGTQTTIRVGVSWI